MEVIDEENTEKWEEAKERACPSHVTCGICLLAFWNTCDHGMRSHSLRGMLEGMAGQEAELPRVQGASSQATEKERDSHNPQAG